MAKAQVFILVAVLFFGKVQAQQCYSCYSITYDIGALPSIEEGSVPCDENYTQSTMDCSAAGGCLTSIYKYLYNIEGQGRVNTSFVIRTCGAALDYCETASQQEIDAQRDANNAMFSSLQFVSASGSVCFCSDNLCNSGPPMEQVAMAPSLGAPATTLSIGALLASLLVSYIAM